MRALLLCAASAVAAAQTPYQHFIVSSPADARTSTAGGFLLAGGGKDQDAAFRWFVRKSGGGDIVVIRASGTGAYNPYVQGMGAVDSVETFVINTPEAARDSFVADRIRKAEGLFIAGGDQWNYVRLWRGGPVGEAIQSLIDKGVPVGGTSASLAVLGEFMFTAEKDTVTSAQALANPYDARVAVGTGFLRIPVLKGIVTDTHFAARDRMGRTLVFLARVLADEGANPARAIAVDERTVALAAPDGPVTIEGEGAAYFVSAAAKPQLCRRGAPLTMRDIAVYRVRRGGTFDLRKWTGTGGTAYTLDVAAGVVRSTQSGGSIY